MRGNLLRAHSPTAIIADEEPLAYLLRRKLVANGVQVPQEISLASFGSGAAPNLILRPATALGRAAGNLLLTPPKRAPHPLAGAIAHQLR